MDDPTLDPVEKERQLLAEAKAEIEKEETNSRWPLLSKLAIVLSVGLVTGYLFVWASAVQGRGGPEGYVRATDFVSTLTGALIIREGNGPRLYDLQTQRDAQGRVRDTSEGKIIPYSHPPFEALLIAPLMDVRYWFAFAVWTLSAGLAIGLAVGFMDGALPVSRQVGWVLSLAVCSYLPVIRSLMLGQNSPFVLMGLCGAYLALKRGNNVLAALSLLLVAFKPQILPVILLLLLLQRHLRTLAIFLALLTLFGLAAMMALGPGWPLDYLGMLSGAADWADNGAANPAIMHNLRGFLTNLFGVAAPWLVAPALVLLSLASAGALVWAWMRSHGGAPANNELVKDGLEEYKPGYDLLWALAGIVAVLTSFHLNPHDMALLIFPAWIIGAYAALGVWGVGVSRLWIAILWAGYALAPLTLYSENTALLVIPSVLLMALAVGLSAAQLSSAPTSHPPSRHQA